MDQYVKYVESDIIDEYLETLADLSQDAVSQNAKAKAKIRMEDAQARGDIGDR